MGHALTESLRVLKPDGILVDLRPFFPEGQGNRRSARQKIELLSRDRVTSVGTLLRDLSGFWYTDRVVASAVETGSIFPVRDLVFSFYYYHDDLESFDLFRGIRWDRASISDADRIRLERGLRNHPEAVIRVDTPIQLHVYRPGNRQLSSECCPQ